jgi:hypothetical protein
VTSYIGLSNYDSRPSVNVGGTYKSITRRNYMEAMASRLNDVDTSDCDEVTESVHRFCVFKKQGNRVVTLKTVS